ncbi:TerC family protein [secondary endosymbiont of Ctenarytaina eucalypti]|uniref:Membrane protein TerC, possibly involved in tellurium resistance n=1 Tax=secondary endosymbiont of Ctenarytaina eucalypti TaxID=1199245 RepID=J3YRQ2_9ENTR|nr:TerC family protein [secondary endosymbiont of Ctenarytaina eucalypti]AFP84773.1 membrane protein TerC, possibly involved in tellurium resistance [secondary endosymbiont of Ctenarytaina eucalypti]
MELLMDSSIWVGLLTLIVLEIVLGIDNVVFIAILSDKLPPKKRDRAQVVGLSLALMMRLGLLSLISWIVTLTRPLCAFSDFSFSGRELILLLGGIFLLCKATTELHERLDHKEHDSSAGRGYASFFAVVVQIVILDAVFSLDAVITAVGIVNNLPVMMIAVVIAMAIMLLASRALTRFVNRHQTVVVLCLSFLLMIGLSLIAEGFGVHIPKGYLYAAIGFSMLIETFNQIARRNFIRNQSIKPMRERTAEAIMRLMRGAPQREIGSDDAPKALRQVHFADEDRHMITCVLSLSSRTLRSVMTPRNKIAWLDCQRPTEELRATLMKTPYNMFPVCNGELDQLIGIVRARDVMAAVDSGEQVKSYAAANPAIVVLETLDVLKLLEELRRAKGSMVMVSNEFGVLQGLVTPLDVLKAIAGEFPDEDETPVIKAYEDGWLAKGLTDPRALKQMLDMQASGLGCENVASLSGLLLSQCDQMPAEGDVLIMDEWRFTIRKMVGYRIELVWIERIASRHGDEQ